MVLRRFRLTTLAIMALLAPAVPAHEDPPFRIQVVDLETGRGVPLVGMTTTHELALITDSAGVIAFDEPDLLGQRVFFHVESPGYVFPVDGFGFAGRALDTESGGSITLELQRVDIAERLYRITGAGIYHHSLRLGDEVPLAHWQPAGKVMGQDTVVVTPYRGRLYWFWGDTDRPSHPLGNFLASGATSELPESGGLDPARGVELHYFVDERGFSKEMCPFGRGHLVWLEWVASLPDDEGRERLVTRYSIIESLGRALAWGIAIFDDEEEVFAPVVQVEEDAGHRSAHPFFARDDGRKWLYLHPNQRVPPTLEAAQAPQEYQAFTALAPGGSRFAEKPRLERDEAGELIWGWKSGTDPLHPGDLSKLIAAGELADDEAVFRLRDVETGRAAPADRGSVAWNAHRERWIWISGFLGSIWFAEADTPVGPWAYARRIVHFPHYSFYNPAHHAFFDQEEGRRIFFEATYTRAFSDSPVSTPRYDYNQLLYGLDLADPRLELPVPVYRTRDSEGRDVLTTGDSEDRPRRRDDIAGVPFFALPPDAEHAGAIPIRARGEDLLASDDPGDRIMFRALPSSPASEDVTGLWRLRNGGRELLLGLEQRGDEVQGAPRWGTRATAVSGSCRDGRIDISMTIERRTDRLRGELRGGELTGRWERDGRSGAWSATRALGGPPSFASEDLLPLWSYREPTTGRRTTTVEGDPGVAGWERSAEPVGRVWRNPLSIVAFDPAEPVGR